MKNRLNNLFTRHKFLRFLELAYTGGAVVLARVGSLLALIYAARIMEPKEYAGLVYAISLSQIIVQLGSFGWLNLIRKESSRFEFHSPALVKGFLHRSFQIPITSISFLIVCASALLYLKVVPSSISAAVTFALILSVPLLLAQILREYMAGYKNPIGSIALSETLPLWLMFVFFAIFKTQTMESAVLCVLFSQIMALIVQAYMMFPHLKSAYLNQEVLYKTKEWTRLASLTVVGYGGKLLMDRMDAIMIAPMVGMEQMAIFNSTSKVAAIVLLMSLVLIQFYSPRVAKAHKANDVTSLRKIISRQLIIVTVAMLPICMALFLYPIDVMIFIFGVRYQQGASILWLSVLSNFIFAYALPFSSFLLMADGERAYAIASIVGLLAYLVLCWLLIPLHGIYGASIALLIATVLMSLFLVKPALSRLL
jgi:O-antigen/teichoic acid export membrane protein